MMNYKTEVIAVSPSSNTVSLETIGVGFGILVSVTALVTVVVQITLRHASLDKQINAHIVECEVFRQLTRTMLEQIQKDVDEIKRNAVR